MKDAKQKIPEIVEVFSEQDKRFNRAMIERANGYNVVADTPKEKNYDFTSDVIESFRQKYGIK